MRPRLEALEDRVVLSTFKVNTTLDTLKALNRSKPPVASTFSSNVAMGGGGG
jgi:hypothetical protein